MARKRDPKLWKQRTETKIIQHNIPWQTIIKKQKQKQRVWGEK